MILRKTCVAVCLISGAGGLCGGSQAKLVPAATVTVCLENTVGVDDVTLDRAELGAAKIFASIALQMDWHHYGKSCPTERDPIMLSITTGTPKNYHPGALGIALPYEGIHIRIFYDRVRQQVRPDLVVPVLAHVLAHEMAHVLMGTDSHSDTGVMKFRWNRNELEYMAVRPLTFSAFDIPLLNSGIATRHTRLAAARDGNTIFVAKVPID
jgi:hypothetical protein